MSTNWRCPTCQERVRLPHEAECEICARRRRYGAIVTAMFTECGSDDLFIEMLDGFDALADLMIERHRTLRRHNREIFDEQREAQRAARDSYAEGRADAQEAERW